MAKLSSFSGHMKKTGRILLQYKHVWIAMSLIYLFVYLFFVQSFSIINVEDLQKNIAESIGDEITGAGSSLILTGVVFGLSSSLGEASSVYAGILFLLQSLAIIWVLRRIYSRKSIDLKQAYFRSMFPLIPFMLLILFMSIQLIPFYLGSAVLTTAVANGLAVSTLEAILLIIFFIASLLLSVFFLTRSIVAAYISTIPNMEPWPAYLKAKKVLKGKRAIVVQRVLAFAIIYLIFAFGLMLLTVAALPQLASIIVAILASISLPIIHIYLFGIYRELIDE